MTTVKPSLSPEGSAPILGEVPGLFTQAVLLSRYQFRDYLRSRRFVLMMAIVAVIGALLSFVLYDFNGAGLTSSAGAFYGTLWAGGVTVVIIFAGIIFGGDAIAGEFQNKTGYFLMGLPVQRSSVYVGKYLAAFTASLVAVVFYFLILIANGAHYLGAGALPYALWESFAVALLYLLALLGSVFLFSSMFKNSLYAVLVVAVLFLFGFTVLQDLISGLVHVTPWFILTYADSIIGGVFNATCMTMVGPHTCTTPGPRGTVITTMVDNATIPEGVAIMIAYFAITAIVGLILFEREEFT
ncbi:MAG: ABC transporter permease [Thermoplasmata archaeon]